MGKELLKKIVNSSDVNKVIDEIKAIYAKKTKSNEAVVEIGGNGTKLRHVSGFIKSNMRVSPDNTMISYSVDDDFIDTLVTYIKDKKIESDIDLIKNMSDICIEYFGVPNGNRNRFFEELDAAALRNTSTDEDYFAMLNNISLSDFRGIGCAECSEFASLTEQALSLFDIPCEYVVGKLSREKAESKGTVKTEDHAFNLAEIDSQIAIVDAANPFQHLDSRGGIVRTVTLGAYVNKFDKFGEGNQYVTYDYDDQGEKTNFRKMTYSIEGKYLDTIKNELETEESEIE